VLKVVSSVRRRLVGVREEEEEDFLDGLDMAGRELLLLLLCCWRGLADFGFEFSGVDSCLSGVGFRCCLVVVMLNGS
jgi:hypothetical protein